MQSVGLKVRAKFYIDATYEGDLMAQAGVPFAIEERVMRVTTELLIWRAGVRDASV